MSPSGSDNGHYVNCPALDFTGVFLHSCPAPASSITLSARQRKVAGIVRPRAFAVFRFMTSSNFMGSSTGRSAGGADGGQHHSNIARLDSIGPHRHLTHVSVAGDAKGLVAQGDRILIPCNDVDRRLESDLITGS